MDETVTVKKFQLVKCCVECFLYDRGYLKFKKNHSQLNSIAINCPYRNKDYRCTHIFIRIPDCRATRGYIINLINEFNKSFVKEKFG